MDRTLRVMSSAEFAAVELQRSSDGGISVHRRGLTAVVLHLEVGCVLNRHEFTVERDHPSGKRPRISPSAGTSITHDISSKETSSSTVS